MVVFREGGIRAAANGLRKAGCPGERAVEPESGTGGVSAFEPLAPHLDGDGRVAERDHVGAGPVGEHPGALERAGARGAPPIEQARVVEALEAALGVEVARASGLALNPAAASVGIERRARLLQRRYAHGIGPAAGGEGIEQFTRAIALTFASERFDRRPRLVGLLARDRTAHDPRLG